MGCQCASVAENSHQEEEPSGGAKVISTGRAQHRSPKWESRLKFRRQALGENSREDSGPSKLVALGSSEELGEELGGAWKELGGAGEDLEGAGRTTGHTEVSPEPPHPPTQRRGRLSAAVGIRSIRHWPEDQLWPWTTWPH